jgi:hypothetical protein
VAVAFLNVHGIDCELVDSVEECPLPTAVGTLSLNVVLPRFGKTKKEAGNAGPFVG